MAKKVLTYLKSEWFYKFRKKYCSFGPLNLWVEPTNACNLTCGMCPQNGYMIRKKGMMNLALFKKIIDEAKGYLNRLNLYFCGESFLHQQLFDMIAYAKQNGTRVRIHTNATLLDEEKSIRTIQSGLDILSFSFDGISPHKYEAIRTGASFEKTLDNINLFLAAKKRLKAEKPYTIMEIIQHDETDEEIAAFLTQYRRNLSVNALNVVPFHSWAGALHSPNRHKIDRYVPCKYLWNSLTIAWNGTVVPCCLDYNAQYALGDINTESVSEIWNNREMLALREHHISGTVDQVDLCHNCERVIRYAKHSRDAQRN